MFLSFYNKCNCIHQELLILSPFFSQTAHIFEHWSTLFFIIIIVNKGQKGKRRHLAKSNIQILTHTYGSNAVLTNFWVDVNSQLLPGQEISYFSFTVLADESFQAAKGRVASTVKVNQTC